MTVYQYNFEDGTDETSYVIDPPAYSGAEIVADTSQAAHGSLSLRVDRTGQDYQFVQKNFSSAVTVAATRFYLYQDSVLTTGGHDIFRFQSTTNTYTNPDCVINIQINGTNKLRIRDSTATYVWISPTALNATTWYRVEVLVQCNTAGAAVVSGAYYEGDSTTAIQTFNVTTATTVSSILSARLGKEYTTGYTTAGQYTWFDDWAIDTAPTGLIGPYDSSGVETHQLWQIIDPAGPLLHPIEISQVQ